MELPEIADFPRVELYPPVREDAAFADLSADRADEARLLALAAQYGPRLLVREVWCRVLPRCGILISSALCGGTFVQRVEEAARAYPHRCWLLVEPMAEEFPLPCPSGSGNRITIIDYDKPFCSDALCCQYTHFLRDQQGVMVLWDTEATICRKMELAKAAGFLGYVSPA